jgi:predicted phage baseplate assembly protein
MPIPLQNFDNRTFEDLVDELRALIPRYAPQWTDHNLSDPGMMLIDLFAWLAEALIYRLNRIPASGEGRFLELLGARFHPAQPATASVVVTASGLTAPLTIARDTPLVARTDSPTDVLAFETIQEFQLSPQAPSGVVSARQFRPVSDEVLGFSTGEPYQVFPVRRPDVAFDPDHPDRLRLQISVAGEQWLYRQSLLDSGATDRHFTLEPRLSAIRFGDGRLGQIPAPGAQILASYLTTRGFGGNIGSGTELIFEHQSNRLSQDIRAALQAGAIFAMVSQAETTDGKDPTSLSEARQLALGILKQRWRAVTAGDFETLAKSITTCKVARAKCLPEKDLTAADPDTPRIGHVSIMVVPQTSDDRPIPTSQCLDEISQLLDKRRLITCRHHVLGPHYTTVKIRADIIRNLQIAEDSVLEKVRTRLIEFFHPLSGGPPESNQKGWPFGRDVYISEVYHMLEDTDGVDYVNSVSLFHAPNENNGWIAANERIKIPPRNLVHFDATSSEFIIRTAT